MTLYRVNRQPLGLEPPQLLGGLTAMACVLAAVFFVAGAWIAGLLLVVVAMGLAALLVAAIKREPHSQRALIVVRASDRAASLGRLSAVAAREWSRGVIDLISHKRPLDESDREAVVRDTRQQIERERAGTRSTTVLRSARAREPGTRVS